MRQVRRSGLAAALAAPLLALAAGDASAQQTFDFAVDSSLSNWMWSGTTSVGNLVGNPTDQFQLTGNALLELTSGTLPVEIGQFVGGDLGTLPDLSGKIPNPIPIFPPLAIIDITNLHIQMTSVPFPIAPNGSWNVDVVTTILSGTLTVTPLTGAPTVTDLTGQITQPAPISGTITRVGNDLHLLSPQSTPFQFTDPSTGISGDLLLAGDLVADWICPTPVVYCTPKLNSQGCTPAIGFAGTPSFSAAVPFDINAANILNKKNGLLFYGFTANSVPFQGGVLCVKAPLKRTPIQSSGGSTSGTDCSGTFSFDFQARIQGHADPRLVPGEEVFTQYWSRDPASPSTTNLTDALSFVICP